MNIRTILLLCITLLMACKAKQKQVNYNNLQSYLYEQGVDLSNKRSVLVLDDKGCVNCNRSFSNLIQHYLGREDVLVINQADGNNIDISIYVSNGKVLNDYNKRFSKNFSINYSLAVFLKGGQIDTLIPIQAKTLEQDISFISKRLKSN